jgi:hypothetical protein
VSDVRSHCERVKDCALNALVGAEIGEGAYRTVYALDDERVLKLELRGESFSNAHEWTLWSDVKDTKWAKWFAPCLKIDEYGAALVMRRTAPLTDDQWASLRRVPNFMADMKRENWGWLDGRPVCHDYGNHALFANGFKAGRMAPKE